MTSSRGAVTKLSDHPEYRTLFGVDIEGYGRDERTDLTRVRLRRSLSRLCGTTLHRAGASCEQYRAAHLRIDGDMAVSAALAEAVADRGARALSYQIPHSLHEDLGWAGCSSQSWILSPSSGSRILSIESALSQWNLAASRSPGPLQVDRRPHA